MASPVTLQTLITRCRQRWNGEGDSGVTDWEITDNLNVSLATEVYDLCRQAVGENYYRKTQTFLTVNSQQTYDLPQDFLSLYSIDLWLSGNIGPGAPKIGARRYTENERNLYQFLLLGWFIGATVLYSTTGQQITFQPTPMNTYQVGLNYVPVSPQLGGGQSTTTPSQPTRYNDWWDDINGWSEIAVLDAAAKCCLKKNRLDMVAAFEQRKAMLKAQVKALLPLRNSGEPLRPQIFSRVEYGDGYYD